MCRRRDVTVTVRVCGLPARCTGRCLLRVPRSPGPAAVSCLLLARTHRLGPSGAPEPRPASAARELRVCGGEPEGASPPRFQIPSAAPRARPLVTPAAHAPPPSGAAPPALCLRPTLPQPFTPMLTCWLYVPSDVLPRHLLCCPLTGACGVGGQHSWASSAYQVLHVSDLQFHSSRMNIVPTLTVQKPKLPKVEQPPQAV